MTNITARLNNVLTDIRKFEQLHHRHTGSVKLLAVSKTKSVESIQYAIDCGQMDFGENYLSEAIKKIHILKNKGCIWHFIGKIQSNKTRSIAENFDWVHTLDRLKIAKRLSTQRPNSLAPLNCCIQINIDNEESKSGASIENAEALLSAVSTLPGLHVRGLMVIPATRHDYADQRGIFSRVQNLFKQLQRKFPSLDTLSMGMSGDLEAAVAQGSTIVRIGTAIFGPR